MAILRDEDNVISMLGERRARDNRDTAPMMIKYKDVKDDLKTIRLISKVALVSSGALFVITLALFFLLWHTRGAAVNYDHFNEAMRDHRSRPHGVAASQEELEKLRTAFIKHLGGTEK